MNAPTLEKYLIQTGRPEHLPDLVNIERAAASLFPEGSIPEHCRLVTVSPDLARQACQDNNLAVAVEKASNRPVGFALLRLLDGLALLAELDVLPAHGRQGLGRALIQATAARAGQLGHTCLYLTTFTHVPWNAPFYRRLGFVPLNEQNTPKALRDILLWEKALGMDHRLAMRLELASPAK